MKTIILDGEKMTSVENTHQYLATKLDFPKYYGKNLDALWDILSTVSEPVLIKLVNREKLINYLGDYAASLISIFFEVAEENEKIHFEIIGL